jgi:hypothetical protein
MAIGDKGSWPATLVARHADVVFTLTRGTDFAEKAFTRSEMGPLPEAIHDA